MSSIISLLTINIHNLYDRWRARRHMLVADILEAQPDLIALQEVNVASGQGNWITSQLNARLGRNTYQLVQQQRKGLISGRLDGVAILTKFPVVLREGLDLGFDGRVALLTNLELPQGQTMDLISVRLTSGLPNPEVRYEQVMRLTGWLSIPGRAAHQVVAGDFNDGPESIAIQRMKQGMFSTYESFYGREPLATFPTGLAQRGNDWSGCLDYVFCTRSWVVHEVNTWGTRHHPENENLFISDHIGILVDLSLRTDGQFE